MTEQATTAEAPPRKGRGKLLLLLGLPVLLGGAGAGAWFAGLIPGGKEAPPATAAAVAEKPVRRSNVRKCRFLRGLDPGEYAVQ